MGLILKPTTEQLKNNNNYKARYVELAKPMAGALAVAIYSLFEDMVDDPDVKIKLSNNIATFICWILGEQIIHRICVYFNLYTKPHSKNPLYRNLKTLSSLGSALGMLLASLSSALFKRKLSFSLYSMLMGSVVALYAFIIRQFDGAQDEASIDAQVGTEGWSKYAKTAFVFGSSIGQCLGGIISYIQNCDARTSLNNITLYSTIASVVSFVSVMLFVPLINYFTRKKNGIKTRGLLITEDRDVFNNNYVRSGIALGVAIGTILGGLLGPIILSGICAPVAIAIAASALSIICGICLGFFGQKLSIYFEKFWGVSHNTDNSWSYATRSTSYFFSCLGIVLTYALCPVAVLAHYAIIASAIASLIGWFAGLFIIWLGRKIEPDETKTSATTLPWTQRLSIGTTRGAIIGAILGLAIGFLAIGPFGLIGWCILFSAVGGIVGGIKEIASDPAFYNMIKKTTSSFLDIINPPKNNQCPVSSNQNRNRYSLFACKETMPHVSQEFNATDQTSNVLL